MKYIITESQENNLKNIIKKLIKNKGIEFAIKSVNGFDNFVKIMDIDSPMDYLHLFDDLEIDNSEEDSDLVLFRFKQDHNIMVLDARTERLYVNYNEIWYFLQNKFILRYNEAQQLIKNWVIKVYNLTDIEPSKVDKYRIKTFG
jgi:hypothetical protein